MLLTTAGSLALWAVAVLSLLSLPDLSRGQQAALGQRGESPTLLPMQPALTAKRSFLGLGCRGVYDKKTFRELEAMCQECFALYWEPELLGLCRSECFTTEYFGGCLQALQRDHQADRLGTAIRRISGRK